MILNASLNVSNAYYIVFFFWWGWVVVRVHGLWMFFLLLALHEVIESEEPHLPAVTNQKNAGLTDERVKSSKDTQPKLVCRLS